MSLESLLASRKTAKGSGKTTGIIVTDALLIAQAAKWLAANEASEKAESALEAVNLTFKPALRQAWFDGNHGKPKPEASLKIPTDAGTVSASFAAQWFPQVVLSEMLPAAELRKKCELKISADLIPEDKQEALVEAVLEVVDKMGCADAFSFKLSDYPRETFAVTRHTLWTPSQNMRMEEAGLGTRLSIRG